MIHILLNLLTLLLYAILYVHAAITVLLCLLASYCAPRAVLFWIIELWARSLFVIIGTRVHVVGRENIPTSNRYMILTNHVSIFDIPALMTQFPYVSWLGRDYLARIPILNHMLKRMNFVPVSSSPAKSVRSIINRSIIGSNKFIIAMYPEGTRTKTGQLQEFKRGFIHIMNGGDLDILPVVINGLFDIKPKTKFSIKPLQKVEIIIAAPIKRASLINMSNEDIVAQVRDIFERHYHYKKGTTT